MFTRDDVRIPMVMDASKMNYFTRANAVRFGMMSTAGALQGLGVTQLQLAKNGVCPSGFYAGPPGGTGNRYCLPDRTEVSADEWEANWAARQSAPPANPTVVQEPPQYKVSYTERAKQMLATDEGLVQGRTRTAEEVQRYLTTGSFDFNKAYAASQGSNSEVFGIPKWMLIGAGIFGVGVVLMVATKKR